MDKDFHIETNRMVLRAFRIDDLDEHVAILSDWQVTKWLSDTIPFPYKRTDGEEFIENDQDDFAKGDNVHFSIIEKTTMRHMGGIRLFSAKSSKCEIGYWLGSDFWHKGYAVEILSAMINWLKSEGVVKNIVAVTAKNNIASQKLLEKVGFQYGGTPPSGHSRCGHDGACSEFFTLDINEGSKI